MPEYITKERAMDCVYEAFTTDASAQDLYAIRRKIAKEPGIGWVSVKDRLPKTHGINNHEADVLLYIPKREGCRQYGIYLGFPRETHMPPDDGSGNFWGVPCPGSNWTVWGWIHFEEPIVTHWMPLPPEPEEVNEDD